MRFYSSAETKTERCSGTLAGELRRYSYSENVKFNISVKSVLRSYALRLMSNQKHKTVLRLLVM